MRDMHIDASGTQFGKYFLLKKLAAGGMGEIYVARQQGPAGFQKILVVKKILPHLTENKEFIEAFLGEARLAAQMNHRNIVQVFELGEHHSAYFIAMEYVAGKTLRDLIDTYARRKERLHPELARIITEQICDGASYAHNLTDMAGRSLNLVHRDLNPQNVLISYAGDVKIIDFGIAKSELSTVKTEAGMIKGKFVYMSPEQSLAKKLDKRSDVFAIGITLYEMLTGINPFHKNNIVLTLEAVQRFDPPPPSEIDPSYAPFDPIVAKALAKDRDRRYADAAEMQDDLRRVILPRPTERLAQVMQRIFRTALEEEQKLLMDTDTRRILAAAAAQTPSKAVATPARAQPLATMPERPPDNATMLLPQTPAKKPVSKPPAKPADTLIDMEPPGGLPPVTEGATGGTAVLSPPRGIATGGAGHVDEPSTGATMMLHGGAKAAPAKKPAARPSTDILTAEESAAAQREAQAKIDAAQNQVVRTRTRGDAQRPPAARGMWLALGAGGLVAVLAIVGVLLWAMQDEAPVARSRAPRAIAAEAEPAPREAVASPVAPAPAAAPAPVRKAAPHAGRVLGTLSLNPGPNVLVTYDGTEYPKQVGAYDLPLTANSGQIEVGDSAPKVTLEYAVAGGVLHVRVGRGGAQVAELDVEGHKPAEVRVKAAGDAPAMTLRLGYRHN